ncbi:MAG: hypothetical protein HY819_09550 [Acidobacteria bacterium]|nr:hypothetical protein [Acidobacteriota bacterium]
MIDIGNGDLFDIVDLNNGKILESEEEFKETYKAGRAALVIDLGYAKYPVLITFLANYPNTPFAIHVLLPPTPSEEHEQDLLNKLKDVHGLRSIKSQHTLRKTKKMVDGYLQFLAKR